MFVFVGTKDYATGLIDVSSMLAVTGGYLANSGGTLTGSLAITSGNLSIEPSSGFGQWTAFGHSNLGGQGPLLNFGRSRGTKDVPTALNSGDTAFRIVVNLFEPVSSVYQTVARFQYHTDATTTSSGAMGGKWTWHTPDPASAAGGPMVTMVLDNLGLSVGSSQNLDSTWKRVIDRRGFVANKAYIVSSLPYTNVVTGAMAFVTDATTSAHDGLGLNPTGGGANYVPTYFNGNSWFML